MSVAVRTAVAIRCLAVAYVVVQVGIWHSFYAAQTWRLFGPAVAILWAAALATWLARHRPSTAPVVADAAVLIALAISGRWWVPPDMRGDTASWLYILFAAQSVFPLWCARLALGVPLVAAAGAAYWAGVIVLSPVLAANSAPLASTALVFVVAAVALIGYQMLDSRAIRADTDLAEADAAEHEQYIALRRHTERREHERLLHDTVLNTLTALSRVGPAKGTATGAATGAGGESDRNEIIGRCRHDVALMEYALGGSSDKDQAPHARDPNGLISVAVEALALEMRARGLDVHVRTAVAGDGQATGTAAGPPGRVAVPVVAAIARAVREALSNVARHAGTGEAWVDMCLPAAGTSHPDGGWLTITVRDRGAGFDPGLVGADRLGIERSIVERIADCGGTATVRSTPGNGTTVTMRVPVQADTLAAPRAKDPGWGP